MLCQVTQNMRIGIRWLRSRGKEDRAARAERALETLNQAVAQYACIHGNAAARAEFNERIENRRGGSHARALLDQQDGERHNEHAHHID